MIKKIVLRDQKRYFWKEGEIQTAPKAKKKLYWTSGDLHTPDGILKEKDLETIKGKIFSHSGKEFFTLDANFLDQIKKINRGPQTLVLKDLGYILIHAGLGKDSIVVDAGTGCGLLAALMGRYAKKVISSITQVAEFCSTTKEHVEKVVELLEREWHVEGKKVRPKSDMLGHTAFLIIVRKL